MQRSKEKLSVGIIGAGNIATNRHIPGFKRDSRVKIIGIASTEGALEVARKFNIPNAFDRVEDLLKLKPDVVTICTPPMSHAALAIAAMEHGCHVLVEKPMAMNSQETASMIETAERCSVALCVTHSFLFARSTRKALSYIEAGDIGDLVSVSGIQLKNNLLREWRGLPVWYQELPGGLFFDDAPHLIYLSQRFMGHELEVISARAETNPASSMQSLKAVNVLFHGENILGNFTMVYNSPISEWLLIILGTKQLLVLDLFRDILIKLPSDGNHTGRDVLATSLRTMRQEFTGVFASGVLRAFKRLSWGHEILIRRFIDSVVSGTPPPVSATEGAQVIASMEEILRQANVPQNQG